MSTCSNAELLRDYAFDELPAAERAAFQHHLRGCPDCAAELDQLRLTTAALRILPDREPPQRIAFVSDKIHPPSRLWNLAPWLGFASAAVMAAALLITVYAAPARPVSADIVRQAVAQAQKEDARIFKAALAEIETRHQEEHKNLIEAIGVLQARENTYTLLAGNTDSPQNGSGQ